MPDIVQPWVDGLTIGQSLRRTVDRFPHSDALVFPQFQTRMTYLEFDAAVDRVARALLGLDVKRGDHIAVWSTNWPEWVMLQFAAARVGAVLVTINPAYRSSELAYVLDQADIQVLFLIHEFKTSNYFQLLQDVVPELATCAGATSEGIRLTSRTLPLLRHVIAIIDPPAAGMIGWSDFLQLGERISPDALSAREAELLPGDPINIQYTSGTTGFPKGATLTHRNLLLNAYSQSEIESAFLCRSITALDACWGRCVRRYMVPRWLFRMSIFSRRQHWKSSKRNVRRRSMACRRCSLRCWITRHFPVATCLLCGPE